MNNINKVFLIGRLGIKPTGFITKNTTQGAKFTLATSERIKKGEAYEERTSWHNIVCFSKLATICLEHLDKGRLVRVEGRISYGNYEDKNGTTRYVTDIIANEIQFLDGRRSASSTSTEPTATA